MEEQTIPSDAPSEYMRGYSDGVEWARQQISEDAKRLDWLASRLVDVQIDGADPLDHFQEGDADDDCPKWWRAAIDAKRGQS